VYLATTIQGFFLVQSTSTHNEAGQGSVPALGASEKTVVSGNAQPVKLHVQLYILLVSSLVSLDVALSLYWFGGRKLCDIVLYLLCSWIYVCVYRCS